MPDVQRDDYQLLVLSGGQYTVVADSIPPVASAVARQSPATLARIVQGEQIFQIEDHADFMRRRPSVPSKVI